MTETGHLNQALTLLVAPTPWDEIQILYGTHPAGLGTKVTVGNASRSSV